MAYEAQSAVEAEVDVAFPAAAEAAADGLAAAVTRSSQIYKHGNQAKLPNSE